MLPDTSYDLIRVKDESPNPSTYPVNLSQPESPIVTKTSASSKKRKAKAKDEGDDVDDSLDGDRTSLTLTRTSLSTPKRVRKTRQVSEYPYVDRVGAGKSRSHTAIIKRFDENNNAMLTGKILSRYKGVVHPSDEMISEMICLQVEYAEKTRGMSGADKRKKAANKWQKVAGDESRRRELLQQMKNELAKLG